MARPQKSRPPIRPAACPPALIAGFIILMVVLAVLMPLFCISLLVVLVMEGIAHAVLKKNRPATDR